MELCLKGDICRITILITVVLTTHLLLLGTNACVIRTCPRAGKRASVINQEPTKECMRCMGDGYCVGVDACCGSFGCIMGSDATKICRLEANNPIPCRLEGEFASCGEMGRCYADRICCDRTSCRSDDGCSHFESTRAGSERNGKLLRIQNVLEKLLTSKRHE
ncbi:conopressin/neurophysin-like [Tubulanus polymorphus]|uniref:conopressin/neurophysin-like n=1 Tax=Tubulanus polymorphus TaxID=672921 RepID=UPI003DA5F523